MDLTVQGWLPDGLAVQDFLIRNNILVGAGSVIEGLDLTLVGDACGRGAQGRSCPPTSPTADWVMVFRSR